MSGDGENLLQRLDMVIQQISAGYNQKNASETMPSAAADLFPVSEHTGHNVTPLSAQNKSRARSQEKV